MSADTETLTLPRSFALALTGMGLVALATFAVSAYGLFGYGAHVLHLGVLAFVLPAGVDLLSLCGIYTTYVTRNDAWHLRAYAWCVFGVPVVASVAGNAAFASTRGDATAGVIGAGFPPILLALAVHSVIVVRRTLEQQAAAARSKLALEAASRRAGGVPVAAGSEAGSLVCVYRFWSAEGQVIRIGHTVDLPDRLSQYRTQEPWWGEVVKVTYDEYPTVDAAVKAERAAIKVTRPKYNAQHNPDVKIPFRAGPAPARVSKLSSGSARAETARRESGDVQKVRELVADGVSCGEAARQLGRSKRWAESHTKDVRANLATRGDVQVQGPAIAAGPADLPRDDAHVDLATDGNSTGDLPGTSD